MKYFITLLIICSFSISCTTIKPTTTNKNKTFEAVKLSDTVSISNDALEYEIIIIEPGFNTWLASIARPEGYYSQQFLENRNIFYVNEWNNRVLQPQRYNANLYEMPIDYQAGINYGYDVNYKLYNYFIFFQITYKQKLGGFVPRI